MRNSEKIQLNAFAKDVKKGLSLNPKALSSKYFYDDEGSKLFQKIMKLPEYYLTQSEYEILRNQTEQIFNAFEAKKDKFDIIEFGVGNGAKTYLLVDYLSQNQSRFRYVPIDISPETLTSLTEKFNKVFPDLDIQPEQGDYFEVLEALKVKSSNRKIILFLGSSIGNFNEERALYFFKRLRSAMNKGDLLFIGFDLHKNPKTILNAYDDSQGITAKFNLNLLKRINRDLAADFNIEDFSHYASYSPLEHAARSFLISRKKQTVSIEFLEKSFEFEKWEPIHVELSQKYSIKTINELAYKNKFKVINNFFDKNKFYTSSLWSPL